MSQRILRSANSDACHVDFLLEIANMLLDFSECDVVVLHVGKEGRYVRCEAVRDAEQSAAMCGKAGTAVSPDAAFPWSVRVGSEPVPARFAAS